MIKYFQNQKQCLHLHYQTQTNTMNHTPTLTVEQFIDKYMGKTPNELGVEKWYELYELMEQDLNNLINQPSQPKV